MAAPRTYYPLDVIHVETSFVSILKRSIKDAFCEACKMRKKGLKTCSKCKEVKYCSVDCQRADWPDHKLECPYLKNLPKDPDEDFFRLLGRVILKIKGKEWDSIKSTFMEKDVSLNEMDSHKETMDADSFFPLFLKKFKNAMTRYIGKDNMPDEYHQIELIGKMKYNMYWAEKDGIATGCFVFIGASQLGLQCIPNTCYSIKNNVMKVWAIKEIKKGTEKVTLNFQNVLFTNEGLDDPVLEKRCRCLDCTYGNIILRKILDEKKAHNVIKKSEAFLKGLDNMWLTKGVDKSKALDNLKDNMEKLLKTHEGVLGHSNLLHIRLLARRCFIMDDKPDPEANARYLLELEKDMSMVFGEYYTEMKRIYEELRNVHICLRNLPQAAYYMQKLLPLERLAPE